MKYISKWFWITWGLCVTLIGLFFGLTALIIQIAICGIFLSPFALREVLNKVLDDVEESDRQGIGETE